jgi:hypothetical protein
MLEKTLVITIVGDSEDVDFIRVRAVAAVEECIDENAPEDTTLTVDWEFQ